MTKDDVKRAIIHYPVGFFTAWLATETWVIAILLGVGFLVYEVIEDWRIHDKSFKDVFGNLIGLGSGGFIFALLGWY